MSKEKNWQERFRGGNGRGTSLGYGTGFLKDMGTWWSSEPSQKTMEDIPRSWTKATDFPAWDP